MPLVLQMAFFIRYYGHDLYYNPRRYPTRDGVIPFSRFFLLSRAARHVKAQERLNDAQSIAHGTALVMGSDDNGALTRFRNNERNEAFGLD